LKIWPLPPDAAARLDLAKRYPYAAPTRSFLFQGGAVGDIAAADFGGRIPVLAHGSNRAPAQLARKFEGASVEREIPVTYGWLADHDVVYSAHVTRYGAVASTLRRVAGCRVRVAVTWLTEGQLAVMHASEGENYPYGQLNAVDLRLEAGPGEGLRAVGLYHSCHGCLAWKGAPLGLSVVEAEGRPHAALAQEEVLRLLRDRHYPGEADLDACILATVADAARRAKLTRSLAREALDNPLANFAS